MLFNKAETLADESMAASVRKTVKLYLRTDFKTKCEEPIKDLPVCEELKYISVKLQIVRHVRMPYECPACKNTDHPYMQKANTPSSLMNHSLASSSTVANVMYVEYVNSDPLYRQKKEWE